MELCGSLNNRLEENRMFCDKIEVGTGVTEYSYTDRKAYEVIEVVDQKHVFIREYDHVHVGDGVMDNNWKLVSNESNPVLELVFRYNHWYSMLTWTQDIVDKIIARDGYFLDWYGVQDKLKNKKSVKTYSKMNVSFGIADYHHDYEF